MRWTDALTLILHRTSPRMQQATRSAPRRATEDAGLRDPPPSGPEPRVCRASFISTTSEQRLVLEWAPAFPGKPQTAGTGAKAKEKTPRPPSPGTSANDPLRLTGRSRRPVSQCSLSLRTSVSERPVCSLQYEKRRRGLPLTTETIISPLGCSAGRTYCLICIHVSKRQVDLG